MNRVSGYRLAAVVGVALVGLLKAGAMPAQWAEPPAGNDSSAVAWVVERFSTALGSGDSTTALSLLAEDAVILEGGGVESRAEYRSHHLPADIGFSRAISSRGGPIIVRVVGDVAWASRTSTAEGTYRGRAVNSVAAELMVLTRGPGGWTIRAIHWSSRSRRPGGG